MNKSTSTRRFAPRGRQGGLTLIELMIAITLDLLIVLAISTVYLKNSEYRAAIERAGQQIENGRYAMQVLSDDLQLAGYMAQLDIQAAMAAATPLPEWPGPLVTTPWQLPVGCPLSLDQLKRSLPYAVQAYTAATAPSACVSDVKNNTAVIAIHRVSACDAGAADCDIVPAAAYFQAASCGSGAQLGSGDVTAWFNLETNLASLTRLARDCATPADRHQVISRVYYVANNDVSGDGIPTLKRADLVGGQYVTTSIANGVEDFQLSYGRDTNGDSAIDVWQTDPTTGCADAVCSAQNTFNVMAVKVGLLARSLDTRKSNYKDTKTYTIGTTAAGLAYTVGPFNDAFERHAFTSTVQLTNPYIRREP